MADLVLKNVCVIALVRRKILVLTPLVQFEFRFLDSKLTVALGSLICVGSAVVLGGWLR